MDHYLKSTLAALVLLFCATGADAQNCAAYPNTFVNGQTANANQVNQNFTTIMSCANNNLAHNAANADITSLNALSTPLSKPQGGTGNTTGQPSGTAGGALTGTYPNPTFAGAQRILQSQVFTSSGTFTVPAGTTSSTVFDFIVVGGGGAGSGTTASGGNNFQGSGGGSGGAINASFSGFTASSSVTVTVGAGESGGTGSGGTGNASSISYNSAQVVTANGGGGGNLTVNGGAVGSASASVGASGLTLVSNFLAGGQPGGVGNNNGLIPTGFGGGNSIGTGAAAVQQGNNGSAGTFGAGGSGGGCPSSSSVSGGSGGNGIVIVEWVL